jgi:hypothetical protein
MKDAYEGGRQGTPVIGLWRKKGAGLSLGFHPHPVKASHTKHRQRFIASHQ